MNQFGSCLAVLMAFILTACTPKTERHSSVDVDLVFWHGKIYTQDQSKPWAEAIAIKDNRIVYVGDNEGVRAFIGTDTELEHLDGDLVLPGFIDTHSHPTLASGMSDILLLDPDDSQSAWLDAVKDYAEDNKDKPYILGFGFRADSFSPRGPTKEILDLVVSDKPVLLIDVGGHSAWVNSKSFTMAGINNNTPDPVPGLHEYQRDQKNQLTGWCKEGLTFYPMMKKLGMASTENIIRGAEDFFWLASSVGVTTMYEAGMMMFEDIAYDALQSLEQNGKLPLRIIGSHMIQNPNQLATAISTLKHLNKTYASELIQPRVMKIHNDGTKEAMTAALFEDYHNNQGHRGSMLLEGEALQNFVSAVAAANFDIHIHAIGDRTVHESLDAFEAARQRQPKSTSRFSIAHIEIAKKEDLPRFAKLDVVAQTTPVWIPIDSRIATNLIGPERARNSFRMGSILKAGGKITFGSDFPAGGLRGLTPVYNIEAGMSRKNAGQTDMATTPPSDERLPLATIIKGYTLDAAYQLNMEGDIGSLEVGKLADLVVLDTNLFESETSDIHKIRVKTTIMNGKVTYKRGWKRRLFELSTGL